MTISTTFDVTTGMITSPLGTKMCTQAKSKGVEMENNNKKLSSLLDVLQ